MVEPLEPGADSVMVADGSHLPQCKVLGHLVASDTNGDSMAYTSHAILEENELNILKNQTFRLGGNVLVVTKHVATYYDTRTKNASVDEHRTEGDAYYCSAKQLLKPMHPKALSDQTAQEVQDK